MIVRISGTGQFELDDQAVRRLDELDTALTEALNAENENQFHERLRETVQFVRDNGKPIPHDMVTPSEVIIPPDDASLEEARRFFTDEGLMAPLPA